MKKRSKFLNIDVITKIKAKEVLRGKVKPFGTGSAHIPFRIDYLGKEVLVIPLEEE